MNALLVDDHALFREALVQWMTPRLPALRWRQAGSLAEAQRQLAGGVADAAAASLVLLDLHLPDSQGLPTLQALRVRCPGVPVVVVSADNRAETVMAALEAGAAGFVPKHADAAQMESALRCVLGGGVYVPPLASTRDGADAADTALLSPRQLEVLARLIDGKSNKLIMRELDLSESTVKTHLRAIFRKLEVDNRTQAALAVARLGLTLPST